MGIRTGMGNGDIVVAELRGAVVLSSWLSDATGEEYVVIEALGLCFKVVSVSESTALIFRFLLTKSEELFADVKSEAGGLKLETVSEGFLCNMSSLVNPLEKQQSIVLAVQFVQGLNLINLLWEASNRYSVSNGIEVTSCFKRGVKSTSL